MHPPEQPPDSTLLRVAEVSGSIRIQVQETGYTYAGEGCGELRNI
jgi:hypothetical protein